MEASEEIFAEENAPGKLYTCGCTKTFPSYRSLNAHLRNKHGGKLPENKALQRLDVKSCSAGGRAPLSHQSFAENFNALAQDFEDDSPELGGNLSQEAIDELFSINIESFEPEVNALKQGLKYILALRGQDEIETQPNFSLSHFFAGFLLSIMPSARYRTVQHFFCLLCLFLGCLRLVGLNAQPESSPPDFRFLAEFFNDFLLLHFPRLIENWKSNVELTLIGKEPQQIKNLMRMLLVMLDWMFLNSLFPQRYLINVEYDTPAVSAQ